MKPLLLWIFILVQEAGGLSNVGKTFVTTFNFNHPSVEPTVLHAFILSTQATQCLVTIVVNQPPLTAFTVSISNTNAVVYTVAAASTRGIKLSAPCDFIVYGLNFATQSADGWLAIPVESLSTDYLVLGVQPWLAEPTQLTIVAANDSTVCKTIFPNGTQHTTNLDAIGVDYMTSTLDLTGTQISCNNPVTVLSGQRCSNVPSGCIACDHTIEQIPPRSTLGRNFALVPLKRSCTAQPTCCADPTFCKQCTEVYRVLAAENDTVIFRNGTQTSESFVLQAGQSRYVLLSQTEVSNLVSTKPVLLGHYFNGQGYEGSNGDPSFAIIPQVESYFYTYQAATCFPQFSAHFVNLVVQRNTSSQLLLNGAPFLNANTAQPIPGTNLEAYQYQFDCSKSNGNPISFVMQHQQNFSFGLFAYGFSAWISYGYPGGMQLNEDVFYKCAPPRLNLSSLDPVWSTACDLGNAIPAFDTPITFVDSQCCGGTGYLTFSDQIINETSCLIQVVRTWTLTDACNRSVSISQLGTVERTFDVYAPPQDAVTFDGSCSNLLNSSNFTGSPQLEIDCDTTIAINFTDIGNASVISRTWRIYQQCTNEVFVYQQMITCENPTTTVSTSTSTSSTSISSSTSTSSTSSSTSTSVRTSTPISPSTPSPTSPPTTTSRPIQTTPTPPITPPTSTFNSTTKKTKCVRRCPHAKSSKKGLPGTPQLTIPITKDSHTETRKKPCRCECPCACHKRQQKHRRLPCDEESQDSSGLDPSGEDKKSDDKECE